MLDRELIELLFRDINEELFKEEVKGEILIVGGAAMCLVYNARESTKDVDGVFVPTTLLRNIVAKVGEAHGLEAGWLNDGVKGFLSSTGGDDKEEVMTLSNFKVWAPSPEYMLAMKCISARADSYDAEDISFLINHLGLTELSEVLALVMKYYPQERIPQKTSYFIEEILENRTIV